MFSSSERPRLTYSAVYERHVLHWVSEWTGCFITCCHLAGAGRIPHWGGEELSALERRDQRLTAQLEEMHHRPNKGFTVWERERLLQTSTPPASSRPHQNTHRTWSHTMAAWLKNRPMRAIHAWEIPDTTKNYIDHYFYSVMVPGLHFDPCELMFSRK